MEMLDAFIQKGKLQNDYINYPIGIDLFWDWLY